MSSGNFFHLFRAFGKEYYAEVLAHGTVRELLIDLPIAIGTSGNYVIFLILTYVVAKFLKIETGTFNHTHHLHHTHHLNRTHYYCIINNDSDWMRQN